MKKVKLLLGCLSLLFSATIAATPNAYSQNSNQNLTLTSDMFGLQGPLSISTTYSENYGLILEGKLTQQLLKSNAYSLELDAGEKERRANLTVGHEFNAHQMMKLTGEYLGQKIDFGFLSGKAERWMGQGAVGAEYDYLFSKRIVQSIGLSTYYSKANSKTLPDRFFNDNGTQYRNLRHIAGGREIGGGTNITLHPFQNTQMIAGLSYDDLHYDMRYEHHSDERGVGESLELNQLLSAHLKLGLSVKRQVANTDYLASAGWLFKTEPGSRLELLLTGERTIGSSGLPNDSRAGLSLSYQWGGSGVGNAEQYQMPQAASLPDVKQFAAVPVVHMSQVLAIKDEAKEVVTGSFNNLFKNLTATKQIVEIKAGQAVHLNLTKYFPLLSVERGNQPFTVSNLPSDLHYNGTSISGCASKADIGKTISVSLNQMAALSVMPLKPLEIQIVGDPLLPSPNPNFVSSNYIYVPNQTITPLTFKALNLFDDPMPGLNSLTLSVSGLTGSGLNWSFTPPTGDDNGTLTISGTTTSTIKEYTIVVSASNAFGAATGTQSFKITVGSVNNPSMTLTTKQFTYHQTGVSVNMSAYIQANSGTLSSINSNQLKAYGLKFVLQSGVPYIVNDTTTGPNGVVKPTTSTVTINDITIQNSLGGQITNGQMKLEISGPPIRNTTTPAAMTYYANQTITSTPLAQFFTVPQNSTAISSWNIRVTGQNGFVADGAAAVASQVGLSVSSNTLQGTLKNIATNSPYTIILTAQNSLGDSIDSSGVQTNLTIPLTVNPVINPSIDLTIQQLSYHQTNVNVNLSSVVHTGTGSLTSISSSQLSQYGLKLVLNGSTVTLENDLVANPNGVVKPTTSTITINDIHMTNSYGGSITNGQMQLQIAGPPIRNSATPAAMMYYANQTITSEPLAQYFDIPQNSSAISSWHIKVTGQNGFVADGAAAVENQVGLVISGDMLQGTLRNIAINSPYTITLTAQNSLGDSINASGDRADLTIPLTVNAVVNPSINLTTQQLSYHQQNVNVNLSSAVQAGSGSITSMSSATLASYGLKFVVNGSTITLANDLTAYPNGVVKPTQSTISVNDIHITNSTGGAITNGQMNLEVSGPPIRNTATPAAMTYLDGEAVAPENLSQYFDIPQNSDVISSYHIKVTGQNGFVADGAAAVASQVGLTISGNTLQGTLKTIAVNSPYSIIITAQNSHGDSINTVGDRADLSIPLAVSAVQNPSIDLTMHQLTYQQKNVNVDITSQVHAGSGTITSISSVELANYGLKLVLNGSAISLENDLTANPNGVVKPTLSTVTINDVHIINSYGGEITNGEMQLQIAGPPVRNAIIPAAMSYTATDAITPENLSSYFDLPQNSDAISSYHIKVTGQNGFVADGAAAVASQVGLTINGNALEGTLKNIATDSPYTIIITARNSHGDSINAAGARTDLTVPLAVNAIASPSIDVVTHQYSYHQKDVNTIITADLHAGSGTITGISSAQLATYGLMFVIDAGQVRIENDLGTYPDGVVKPTLNTVTINDIHLSNSYGGSITNGEMRLEISGPPVRNTVTPTAMTYIGTETITPVDISQYFSLATNSAAISGYQLKVEQGGQPVSGNLGLSIVGNNLEGTLENVATNGSYQIIITAQNSAGDSIDENGVRKDLTIPLTLNAVVSPSVTLTTQQFSYHQQNANINFTSDVNPGTGTITSISSAELANYGLKFVVNGGTITIENDLTAHPEGVTKPTLLTVTINDINVTNSYGASITNGEMKLEVSAPPVRNTVTPSAMIYTSTDTIPPVDLSQYFVLATNSAPIDGYQLKVEKDGQAVSGNLGLSIVGNNLEGTLGSVATNSVYQIIVTAHNSAGDSIDENGARKDLTIPLTVNAVASPSIDLTIHQFAYQQKDVNVDVTSQVHAGSGTIASISSAELANYGLKFNVNGSTITLENDLVANPNGIVKPTLSTVTLNDIHITNSYGASITNGEMALEISGPPVRNATTPTAMDYTATDAVSPVSLAQFFAIPQHSDAINGWHIKVTGQNGFVADGAAAVSSQVGLTLNGDTLEGTLKNIPADSPYTIILTAQNSSGDSINAMGARTDLTIPLSVQSVQAPSINVTTQQLSYHQKTVNINLSSDVNAGSGSITSISSAELATYGLKFVVNGGAITLENDLATNPDGVVKPTLSQVTINDIHITNSYGASCTNGEMKLEVSGPPVRNTTIPTGMIYTGTDSITPINLSGYFTPPINSSIDRYQIKVETSSGDVVTDNLGLTVNGQTLAGTLDNVTTTDTYHIIITASNNAGDSIDANGVRKDLTIDLALSPYVASSMSLLCPTTFDSIGRDGVATTVVHDTANNDFTFHTIDPVVSGFKPGFLVSAQYFSSEKILACRYRYWEGGSYMMTAYNVPPAELHSVVLEHGGKTNYCTVPSSDYGNMQRSVEYCTLHYQH